MPVLEATADLSPIEEPQPSPAMLRRRWLFTWVGRVAEFGFVQCWVQLLAGIAGIIVVRTLSKQDYALYVVANTMQGTCNLLADIGIGIGMTSIGGRVWNDRRRLGELVNTAVSMRRLFATSSVSICVPLAAWMLWRNGADVLNTILLCAILVVGVLPQLQATVMRVVPQLHGEYRRLQHLDLGNALLRLALIGFLAISRMNAWLAAAVGAISSWVQMIVTRRWASEHLETTAPIHADDRRELWRLSLRQLPNTLFFCFQGQVTLLILTLVGNPQGVADIGALGRLSMLLTAFSAAFSNVLAPRFARCQDSSRLPRLYLMLIGAVVLVLWPIVAFAWFFPAPLLWLLGNQYESLQREVGWMVLAGSIAQLSTMMWMLNSSRAWIRFASLLWIPLTLVVQAMLPFVLDLSEFHNVLIFQAVSALIPLPILALDAALGILRVPTN